MAVRLAVTSARGADTPIWAATDPGLARVTGKYFEGRREKDGKFREPTAIADLEQRCRAMVGLSTAGAASRRVIAV